MPKRHPPAFVVVALLALACLALATQEVAARPALEVVAAAALPKEARATLERIHQGGPFPYSRVGNREHILPAQPRGYYHEYTVPTPGVRTRGARRIVCGGDVTSVSECYYSDDHYQTFQRIRP
jgi:ribonuclease T1